MTPNHPFFGRFFFQLGMCDVIHMQLCMSPPSWRHITATTTLAHKYMYVGVENDIGLRKICRNNQHQAYRIECPLKGWTERSNLSPEGQSICHSDDQEDDQEEEDDDYDDEPKDDEASVRSSVKKPQQKWIGFKCSSSSNTQCSPLFQPNQTTNQVASTAELRAEDTGAAFMASNPINQSVDTWRRFALAAIMPDRHPPLHAPLPHPTNQQLVIPCPPPPQTKERTTVIPLSP
ncbi:hypothetical protein Fcan01_22553 [Folsomia candida]|uniref:Uncharacterized protein n=1 Tax=Folsomia candida TaxID=158441 RepID=A0A226DD61_FOLCA|nr:hypothetical protein Fcan01_22553 [Folsomia candida]